MTLTHRLIALAAAMMATGAAAQNPLIGIWGAGDTSLILDAQGGQFQRGCKLVTLGAIQPDADGRFSLTGQETQISALPPDEALDETAAEPSAGQAVTLTGRATGRALSLTLTAPGQAPRQITLMPGQRGTQPRCL